MTNKMRTASSAASAVEYVIHDAGPEMLLAGSLVLRKDLGVSFQSGKPQLSKENISVVRIADLEESKIFGLINEMGMGDTGMLQQFIDPLVIAAIRKFEAECPEFAKLPTS